MKRREFIARRNRMHLVLIGLVTVAAAMVIDAQMASAINYDSFFQERYCSRRANGRYNCAFKTLEQCNRAIEESAEPRFCIESPWWGGPQQPTTQGKSRRSNR